MLVRFGFFHEVEITDDPHNDHFNFNLNWFNKDVPRQMLYGYLEVFDQFESRRNFFLFFFFSSFFLPGVDASRVYVRAWALGCFHSLISISKPFGGR